MKTLLSEVTDQSGPFYQFLALRLTRKRNYSVYLKAASTRLGKLRFGSIRVLAQRVYSFSILGTSHPVTGVIVPVLYPIQLAQHRE